mmetsp:Transcript_13820/g.28490  ORF Transcript_13820/g.28490 Transcript_13820/m.28490 type:complete len:202 (+) Transcript_13820:2154-2759(+)
MVGRPVEPKHARPRSAMQEKTSWAANRRATAGRQSRLKWTARQAAWRRRSSVWSRQRKMMMSSESSDWTVRRRPRRRVGAGTRRARTATARSPMRSRSSRAPCIKATGSECCGEWRRRGVSTGLTRPGRLAVPSPAPGPTTALVEPAVCARSSPSGPARRRSSERSALSACKTCKTRPTSRRCLRPPPPPSVRRAEPTSTS